MELRLAVALCAACLGAVALAPSASAQAGQCQPAPGRSGLEQYCEALPGDRGPEGRTDTGGPDGGAGGRIPPSSRSGLEGTRAGQTLIELTGGIRLPDGRPLEKKGAGGSADVGPTADEALKWIVVGVAAAAGLLALLRYFRRRGGALTA